MTTTTLTTTNKTVVAVDSLTKRYGRHTAVDSLSFEVPAGQVIGLLGPNGAGKTTAMKMLLGLVRPTSGRATLLGTDVAGPNFAHAVRRVGALVEAPALYERLSARKNLVLQAKSLGIPAATDAGRIDELLELVDLTERADDRAGTYSLGMKQRLGIAVGLLGNPELVVLDEPANGLDPAGIVEMRHLLRRLPSMGTTVLVSSHQLSEVQQACDRLVVLANGRLITEGTTEDIIEDHSRSSFTVRLDEADLDAAVSTFLDASVTIAESTTNSLSVNPPDGWSGRSLNQILASNGVFANELVRDSVSLEEAFLAMTTGEDNAQR